MLAKYEVVHEPSRKSRNASESKKFFGVLLGIDPVWIAVLALNA